MFTFHILSTKKALRKQTFAINNVGIKKVTIGRKVQIAYRMCQILDTQKNTWNKFVVNLESII